MSPDLFIMVGGLLFTIFIYMFLGRVICREVGVQCVELSSALFYMMVGLACWYLAFLGALAFDRYMMTAIWWGFVLFSLLLFLVLLKRREKVEVKEHFWTQILMSLIFIVPTIFVLAGDTPQLMNEFSGALRQVQYMIYKGYMPPLAEAKTVGLNMFDNPPGLFSAVLPTQMVIQNFVPSVFALFNVLLLLCVADNLARVTQVRVKWSNLPLVSAATLVAITVFDPFFELENVTSAQVDILYAAVLYAAVIPLIQEKSVPTGIKSVPVALILSLLVGLHELGVVAAGIIAVLAISRIVFEKEAWNFGGAFSVFLMIALPLISWLLWQHETYDAALAGAFDSVKQYGILPEEGIRGLGLNGISVATLLLLFGVSLTQIFHKDVRENIRQYMWLFIPTLVVFGYILVGSLLQVRVDVSHLQFVILIPLWRWAMWWYEGTAIKETTYKYPWIIGLGIALLFVVVQSLYKKEVQQHYDDAQLHTFNTGRLLAREYILDREYIGILEIPRRALYTQSLIKYALADKAGQAVPVASLLYDAAGDRALFYKKLQKRGITYLWVHAPYAAYAELFDDKLNPRASYLFRLERGRFIMERQLRHPNYTAEMLDNACKTHDCRLGAWRAR